VQGAQAAAMPTIIVVVAAELLGLMSSIGFKRATPVQAGSGGTGPGKCH